MKFKINFLKFALPAGVLLAGSAGFVQAEELAWTNSAWQDSAWNARGCFPDQRGQWFRDAKFGAFIHFGAYSELGGYYQGKGPYDPAEQIIGLGDRRDVIPPGVYRKEFQREAMGGPDQEGRSKIRDRHHQASRRLLHV